jgi:hypothetical protein
MICMSTRPHDTSGASWRAQREIIGRMDPAARVRTAVDLSDSVRELQIEGLLARHPTWGRSNAVEWLIRRLDSSNVGR